LSRAHRIVASLFVAAALTAAVSAVVFSSFTSTAKNAGNTFQAGSIALTANVPGTAVFGMSGLKPGDTQARCIRVGLAAAGGLVSSVRLYGTTTTSAPSGPGLARYLALKVTRGTFAGAAPAGNDCAGFTADGGNAVLFDDALSAYPASYAAGVADAGTAWKDADSAVYRLEVTALDDDRAQGLDATTEFAFEARTS
jgi:hypothetical protein